MLAIKGLQLTKRELRNVSTGIDLSVPSYEDASSPKRVQFYHVVVISRLVHFKRGEHSSEDVVQFMVQRKYSDFEQLQENLLQSHPELALPPLPKWNVWFLNEDDLEDRKVSFDSLLKKLARDKYFATCLPLLEFLGVEPHADRKYFTAREKFLEAKKRGHKADNTDEVLELFGDDRHPTEDEKLPPLLPADNESLFEDRKKATITAAYKMPEDTSMPLFMPTEAAENTKTETIIVEDNSDLLRVEESLDDILKLTAPKLPKQTPVSKKMMPASTAEGGQIKQRSGGNNNPLSDRSAVDEMDDGDITRYIEQENNTDSDVDLFS